MKDLTHTYLEYIMLLETCHYCKSQVTEVCGECINSELRSVCRSCHETAEVLNVLIIKPKGK